ncbi:hypothetical protein FJZ26_00585 [Candidatus Parvarchaeota archaeon]|nr:hypothetical protein [Candidatus Parvarchaeota archaeon]
MDIKNQLRQNGLKIFVFLVIGAFIFETIALGFLGGSASQNNQGQASPAPGEGKPQVITGTIIANGTLSSFDAVLYVAGPDIEKAAKIKDALIGQGIATYAVIPDNKSMLINLVSSSKLQEASRAFSGINVTTFAKAQIEFSGTLTLKSSDGQAHEVIPSGIFQQFSPRFREGDTIPLSFSAEAQLVPTTGQYQLARFGQVSIMPQRVVFETTLPILLTQGSSVVAKVPFESRTRVKRSELEANLSDTGAQNIKYSPKSYIEFSLPASAQQIAQLQSANLSYLASISADFASVQDSFIDREQASNSLSSLGPVFPDSIVTFDLESNFAATMPGTNATDENQTSSQNQGEAIVALTNYLQSAGINGAKVETTNKVLVGLSGKFNASDGKAYEIFQGPTNATVLANTQLFTLPVTIDALAVSDQILQINSVKAVNYPAT